MQNLQLTATQQKYLITLYRLQITGVKQIDVANELGVSKSGASKIIQDLIEMGLIQRRNRYEMSLSKQGEIIAERLDDQYTAVTRYLLDGMDLEEEIAQKEALEIALCMSGSFLESFMRKIETQQIWTPMQHTEKRTLHDTLKPGEYTVPFQLLHLKEEKVSMGDKGFQHPCTLTVQPNGAQFALELCNLACSSVAGRVLSGGLQQLWYYDGSNWTAADIDGAYCRIPAEHVQLQCDSHGSLRSGELQVRVRATVGIFAMPESYARLKFNFRSCKQSKPCGKEDAIAVQ